MAIAVISILIISMIYVDNGDNFNFTGNYAFDIELEDPSFHILTFNNTTLNHDGIYNTSYNSTHITINIPQNWLNGSAPVYEIVNSYSAPVSFNLFNNFTNGALFTYLIMKNGQEYYDNVVHNTTFEILNLSSGNYSMVVVHNITSDAQWSMNYTNTHNNTEVIILGDGLPVLNTNIHITLKPNYYVYIGISTLKIYHLIHYETNVNNQDTYETGGIYV